MTTTPRPASDPEVEALNTIISALEGLEEARRRNVLLYINVRYAGLAPAQRPSQRPSGGPMTGSPTGEGTLSASDFADLGDLVDRANPQNQADRVLVVAYWKQV